MGGLGPGIGGFEILVIGLVALLVVGPKDLPVMMRRVGQMVGRARAMASDFRASFDEMARQSELDNLRKEVEALRSGSGMHALGADADAAFKDIRQELEGDAPAMTPLAATSGTSAATPAPGIDPDPVFGPTSAPAPAEWPEPEPASAAPQPAPLPSAAPSVQAVEAIDAPDLGRTPAVAVLRPAAHKVRSSDPAPDAPETKAAKTAGPVDPPAAKAAQS